MKGRWRWGVAGTKTRYHAFACVPKKMKTNEITHDEERSFSFQHPNFLWVVKLSYEKKGWNYWRQTSEKEWRTFDLMAALSTFFCSLRPTAYSHLNAIMISGFLIRAFLWKLRKKRAQFSSVTFSFDFSTFWNRNIWELHVPPEKLVRKNGWTFILFERL